MIPKPRIDVFISSTSIDLPEYRAAVRDAILTLGLYPSGMETWTPQDESPVELCRRMVADAEILVGIYAYRYGWCPPDHDGKSITELEYDWATERKIPRLCFIMSDDHPFPENRKDKDASDQVKLKAFKDRVKERVVGFFTNSDDLKARVTAALAETSRELIAEMTRPTCNFVPNPEHFVGRVDELAALRSALSTDGAVTAITALKGIGGIGKTTLACAYANQDDRFQLKLYASLGQNYRENLESSVMETWIGGDFHFAPGTPLDQMIAYTRQHLMNDGCGTPVLLLIDDVWADTVNAARNLRAAAPPNTRVLITTRSEDVAAALDADTTRLDALSPDEGADLMLDLIRDKRAETTRTDLKAISTLLAGHSLALALAARQLRRNFQTRRVKELKDTLEKGLRDGDAFPDLKLERADAASKQDSVSLTLKLTLDALHADDPDLHEKRLKQFRALGALPPDIAFRARHVYAIWEDEDADALDDFAAEGLITVDENRDDWYTQHRLLRAFARAQLREHSELEVAEANHRQYVIGLALAKSRDRRRFFADLQQIDTLGIDLATRLTGTSDPTVQQEILLIIGERRPQASSSVQSLFNDPGLFADCSDFAIAVIFDEHFMSMDDTMDDTSRSFWQSIFLLAKDDDNSSSGRMLAMARALGDKQEEATILQNIAYKLMWGDDDDVKQAVAYYEKALRLLRKIGDKHGAVDLLSRIGFLLRNLGDNAKTLDFYEKALPLLREVGDKSGEAINLKRIGTAWDRMGDKQKALDFYEKALPLLREVGNIHLEAVTLSNIAIILWEQGDRAKAMEYMQTARAHRVGIDISTKDEDSMLSKWRSEMDGE